MNKTMFGPVDLEDKVADNVIHMVLHPYMFIANS